MLMYENWSTSAMIELETIDAWKILITWNYFVIDVKNL